MFPRTVTLAVGVALALSGVACSDQPTGLDSRVVGLSVPEEAALTVGQQLQVHAVDAGGRSVPGVTVALWSADPTVATVDPTGTLTAVAPGSTEIIASAGGFGARIRVTVSSGADLQVAEFRFLDDTLHRDPPCYPYTVPICPPLHLYVVDNWTLAPTALAFVLRNAGGESLCGKVPVSISLSDSTLATAVYDPLALNPCTIRLTALANGWQWLVASAGTLRDSTQLRVVWSPQRVFMDGPRWEADWTVGTEYAYTFTALSPPATGLTPLRDVTIGYTINTVPGEVVTGADGEATVRIRPTESSRRVSFGEWAGEWVDSMRFEATADYGFHHREAHLVRPGPPHQIMVFERPYGGNGAGVWCYWQEVGTSASSYNDYVCGGGVLVVVGDAYGNPTEVLPSITWTSGARPESWVEPFENRQIRQRWVWMWRPWGIDCGPESRIERRHGRVWGRGVLVFASGASDTFTATYPGLAAKTATVTNRRIPPPDPNDPGDFRNQHCLPFQRSG